MRNGMLASLGIVTSALMLAGCAPEPQMPRPMTPDELAATIELTNRSWWESMFPDEPMPEIEPVAYLGVGDPTDLIDECVLNANLPGVVAGDQGGFSMDGGDEESQDAFNRRYFICAMTYPTDYTDVDLTEIGWLGQGQLGWLYDYFTERSAPCLSLLGYRIPAPPTREDYIAGYYLRGAWNPYFQAIPYISDKDWPIVDYHCPPPPIGGEYQL